MIRPRVRYFVAAAVSVMVLLCTACAPGTLAYPRTSLPLEACEGHLALQQPEEHCLSALDGVELQPTLEVLQDDVADTFVCFTMPKDVDLVTCDPDGDPEGVRVAIVGDSHAAMIAYPLSQLATEAGWNVTRLVSNGCVWTVAPFDEDGCEKKLAAQQEILLGEEPFDVVIVSSVMIPAYRADAVERINERFDQLIATGAEIVVVQDNPYLDDERKACVLDDGLTEERLLRCAQPRVNGYGMIDQYLTVATSRDDIKEVRTADLFCNDRVCPLVVGGTVVYRDSHHLTASYSAMIAPELLERIREESDKL